MLLRKIILFVTILLPSLLMAQVIEERASMSEGVQNAFVIELEGANKKIAEKVWKQYIGKIGKTKRNRKSKEWRSKSIVIPAIDNNYNVNLTGKFEDLRGNSRAYVWLKMDGNFINSEDYTNEARGIKEFLEEYALNVKKAVIGKEVEEEQKRLKSVEKGLEKLIKKNNNFHRDIEKANEAIIKAEKKIEDNVIAQEGKRIEIEEQKAALLKVQEKLMAVGKDK
ncbi:MAG: hypothetical protein V3V00_11145 [Saprospiraceae bacterium]